MTVGPWLLLSVLKKTAKLSTFLQILIFLPLTLATLSRTAFLLLSLLLSAHALIHGTLISFWGSPALSFLQVPMHSFLLLVCFNAFSTAVNPWLLAAAGWWGKIITFTGPANVIMEGMSTLLVAQKLGQEAKKLVEEGETEIYQFGLLIVSAMAYVLSAYWIVVAYPAAASSPLSSTLLGCAITVLLFLTVIGFSVRRTNIVESSALALGLAYNVWLCGFNQDSALFIPGASYLPLLPNMFSHFQTLFNFVMKTLPKPILVALIYRLGILHMASRILPYIGADKWEPEESEERPTSALTALLLRYRQFLFITMYTHFLLLDHSSQLWWRWINIFFTLLMWSVELFVSADDDVVTKEWKID